MKDSSIELKNETRWDLLSLGEVLLRFDPVDEPISRARNFRVWDGGGEYNVAKNLSSIFRRKTGIVTALADNALGRLAEDFVRQGGVDASQIIWRDAESADGGRNGVYFIERGFGLRPPSSCFDRSQTAVAALKADDIDWNSIFGAENAARWLHTGGIFAGLSDSTAAVAHEAMRTARAAKTFVSYDLNYRDSLWKKRGGRQAANAVNGRLLADADAVFGIPEYVPTFADFDPSEFQSAAETLIAAYPNLKVVIVTLREILSASQHHFRAACFAGGEVHLSREYRDAAVLDRVGSGDAFAAGLIEGLLRARNWQFALDCGAACAVLTMTTPGDNSTANAADIERLMQGANAAVLR